MAFAKLFYPDDKTNQIRPFQKDSPQLLVGAPTQTIGYSQVQPGAVYILDVNPKDIGLNQNLYNPNNTVKQIDMYPWVFAYGNQRGLGGSLMYGENSGDLFGSRIINVGNFIGNVDKDNVSKPRDVVAFPTPAALSQSGTMPMYIANDGFPAQSFQIDPFSDEGHSFQYLGDDAGANPPLDPAGSGFARNSSALYNFAPQNDNKQSSAQQDLVISRNAAKPNDPGAYFLYGKPYLFAGEQIASSNISGGVGFAVNGAGVPIALGDLNGDGYDDYTFYPVKEINSTTDPVQFNNIEYDVYFGSSPSALSAFKPQKFVTNYPQTLNYNYAYYGRSIFSLPFESGGPSRFSYFRAQSEVETIYNSQTSTASDVIQTGLGGLTPANTLLIANGQFVEQEQKADRSNQRITFAQLGDDLVITAQYGLNDNPIQKSIKVPAKGNVESIVPVGKVRGEPGNAFFSSRVGKFGDQQQLSLFRLGEDLKPKEIKADIMNDAYYTFLTGSFAFRSTTYITGYNIKYPNGKQTVQPFIYEYIGYRDGAKFFADFAFESSLNPSILQQSVINPIGDFNADGLPDIIRMTKNTYDGSKGNAFNSQEYKITYGSLNENAELIFSQSDDNTNQLFNPLPNQPSVAPFTIGDLDGTGGDDLGIGAIPQSNIGKGIPESLTSFVIYDTEVSIGSTIRRTGGAGDDILKIDENVLPEKLAAKYLVFNGKQGNDIIDFTDNTAVSNYKKGFRWLSLSGGSGDDSFKLSDQLVTGLSQRFSLRGDGGFDEVTVSQSDLKSDSRLDLTQLLTYSEDIENLTLDIPKAQLDISKLASLNVDYFSKQPLWIDGKAGTSLLISYSYKTRYVEPFLQENTLTRLGNTYDVLRDPISGLRIAISTNIAVTRKEKDSPGAEFTLGTDLQPILNVTSPGQVVKMNLSSDAAFANSIGFYPLLTPDGSIKDPITGDVITSDSAVYLSTAKRLAEQAGFSGFGANSTSEQIIETKLTLSPGLWAPIVQTDTGSETVLYSSFNSQTDLAQHFRTNDNSSLLFEDLSLAVSDFDSNDVKVELVGLVGQTVPFVDSL